MGEPWRTHEWGPAFNTVAAIVAYLNCTRNTVCAAFLHMGLHWGIQYVICVCV